MARSTRSETFKVQEREREMREDMVRIKLDDFYKILTPPFFMCQDLFAKVAEATGESLESVCQMREEERNGLIEALNLRQVELKGFFAFFDGAGS